MDILVNIDVAQLEQAIEFYQKALDLRLGRRLFGNTVAEMLGASAPIYLMAKESGTSPNSYTSQIRDYCRHWTPVHLDFVVHSIQTAVEKAVAAGAKLEGEIQTFPWGYLATLSDPFGHGLCFVQWRSRGYDEVSEPQNPQK